MRRVARPPSPYRVEALRRGCRRVSPADRRRPPLAANLQTDELTILSRRVSRQELAADGGGTACTSGQSQRTANYIRGLHPLVRGGTTGEELREESGWIQTLSGEESSFRQRQRSPRRCAHGRRGPERCSSSSISSRNFQTTRTRATRALTGLAADWHGGSDNPSLATRSFSGYARTRRETQPLQGRIPSLSRTTAGQPPRPRGGARGMRGRLRR